MSLQRYEIVKNGQLDGLNQRLAEGWKAVRETPMAGRGAADHEVSTLVLLEREDEFPRFPGEELVPGVSFSAVEGVSLFNGMLSDELRELLAACELQSFAEDDVIFEAGDESDALFVILSGEVRLDLPALRLGGNEILQLGPMDTFGESTFFAPAEHSASAVATTDLQTLRLSRNSYLDLLQGQRQSAYKLAINAANLLGSRLQATDQWVHQLLEEDQSRQIATSWHRFRSRMGGLASTPGGLFHV